LAQPHPLVCAGGGYVHTLPSERCQWVQAVRLPGANPVGALSQGGRGL